MRSLRILLLFTATVFADNRNYNGETQQDSRYPMDYFDDIYNRDFKLGPDSTFSFNFEQTRHDQPPQIEMREENVGRYIHTRPQTTTPASLFSMKADRESQHVYPNMISANNFHQPPTRHWNQQQMQTVPPPPKFAFSSPPTNRFSELQRNPVPTWNAPTVHRNNHHRVPSHPVQWTQPPKPQSTPAPYLSSTNSKRIDDIKFSPSASYVSDSITKKNFHIPSQALSLPSRGSHKFNWDDIKKNAPPTLSNHQAGLPQMSVTDKPSTPQSIHNKPPPPVPTLSPWYDNFGK